MEHKEINDIEQVAVSIRIPRPLLQVLKKAGVSEFKRGNSLNLMINKVLHDWHESVEVVDTDSIPPIITHNNQDVAIKTKRKRATV